MDSGNQAVSLPVIGGVGAIAAGFLLWAVTRLVTLRRRTPVYGVEHLTEEPARAISAFTEKGDEFRGFVRLNGERWQAVSDGPVAEGASLQVLGIDGLTVRVTAAAVD